MIKSECCDAPIYGTLGDGVLIGWCSKCKEHVSRMHPSNGKLEWLDGESPWTTREDLREMKPKPKLISRPGGAMSKPVIQGSASDVVVNIHALQLRGADSISLTFRQDKQPVLKERKTKHEYLVCDPTKTVLDE